MQTANEHEQGPVFLGCGVVGKVQYSGFTRFLQVDTATLEHLSQPNMQQQTKLQQRTHACS